MIERLTSHFETILAFAGVSGLIAAGYRLWLSQSTIARHHEALSRFFDSLARPQWLDLMQDGVLWFLDKLSSIYGPPASDDAGRPSRFLTVRAWKTSAWIAAYLLFSLPSLVFAVAIPIGAFRGGQPVPWEPSAIFCAFWLFVTLVFFIAYRFSRSREIVWEVEDLTNDFIHDSCRMAAFAGVPATALGFVGGWLGGTGIIAGIAIALAVLIGLGGIIFGFIHAIRRYGFLAPLAFAASLTILGFLLFNIVFAILSLVGPIADLGAVQLVVLAAAGLSVAVVVKSFDRFFPKDDLVLMFIGLIMLDAAMIYFGGPRGEDDLLTFATGFVGVMLGIVLPYTLALYAAVYSNSIPDWCSIAMTRHFLAKAASAKSGRLFLLLLVADLAMASACVVATFLIVVVVFALCGILVSLSIGLVHLGPYYDSVASFFFGGAEAARILFALASGTPVHMLSSGGPASAGGLAVLLLVAISSTSLLPSLVNAAILAFLLAGRVAAKIVMKPAKALHGSLLVAPGASEEERRLSLLRSSVLIGIGGAVFCALVLCGFLLAF